MFRFQFCGCRIGQRYLFLLRLGLLPQLSQHMEDNSTIEYLYSYILRSPFRSAKLIFFRALLPQVFILLHASYSSVLVSCQKHDAECSQAGLTHPNNGHSPAWPFQSALASGAAGLLIEACTSPRSLGSHESQLPRVSAPTDLPLQQASAQATPGNCSSSFSGVISFLLVYLPSLP